DMENVEGETIYVVTPGVSTTGALVSTARPTVSTARPSTSVAGTSTGILEDEMVIMDNTLIAIRQTRTRPSYLPRPTSVVIIDTEQEQHHHHHNHQTIETRVKALTRRDGEQFTIEERA
ncbi:hypothetical protein Tco_0263721, partial [Tanacetum coccineum]